MHSLLGSAGLILVIALPMAVEVYGCAMLATAPQPEMTPAQVLVLAQCVAHPLAFLYIVLVVVPFKTQEYLWERWRVGDRLLLAPIFLISMGLFVWGATFFKDGPGQHWVGIHVCQLILNGLACAWSGLGMFISEF
jgi:hypothetical protein